MTDGQLRAAQARLAIAVAGRFLPEFRCGCGDVHWTAVRVARVELSSELLAFNRRAMATRAPSDPRSTALLWAGCFQVVGEATSNGTVRHGALCEVLSDDEILAALDPERFADIAYA